MKLQTKLWIIIIFDLIAGTFLWSTKHFIIGREFFESYAMPIYATLPIAGIMYLMHRAKSKRKKKVRTLW